MTRCIVEGCTERGVVPFVMGEVKGYICLKHEQAPPQSKEEVDSVITTQEGGLVP